MSNQNFESLKFQELSEQQMLTNSESFYESIKTRRTVRDFSERTVPIEIINNCIIAAGTAPNGANLQPWHFSIISDPVIKNRIRTEAEIEEQEFYNGKAPQEWLDALAPLGTDEHKPFLETAPYLIVIFSKTHVELADGTKVKQYYPTESVGIATGMLITALHQSGLATLTHTPSPMRFLNEILGRPKFERPFLILVAGYPAADAQVPCITKKKLSEIATHH